MTNEELRLECVRMALGLVSTDSHLHEKAPNVDDVTEAAERLFQFIRGEAA